ncbi:MAG: type II toxin-antitoxin system VapC family toxin [Bauldia sp.]
MLLLDTHALVFWANGADEELSVTATAAIDASQDALHVSAMSAWEIAMLARRGRIGFDGGVLPWLAALSRVSGLTVVPIDVEIAVGAVELPGEFHADPADRIIVATARKLNVPLLTRDVRIRKYSGVTTIW